MNLRDWVKERRWFRAKSKGLAAVDVDETFPLALGDREAAFTVVNCRYDDGSFDRYVLVTTEGSFDVLGDEAVLGGILAHFNGRRVTGSQGSTLVFRSNPGFTPGAHAPRVIRGEQTNTSVLYGDACILKLVRKLDEGVSAELEMGDFLTRHGYASAPPVLGAIELEKDGAVSTVGVLHRLVPNCGDAWSVTLHDTDAALAHAWTLGRRVGEMHVALAGGTEPAFVPERIDRAARQKLAAHVESAAAGVAEHLRPGDLDRIASRLAAFVAQPEDPIAMRIHGDLHLGQILATDTEPRDFVIIDFEGEPARSLPERKAKRSPFADVAGMLRSFDYAAATALRPSQGAAAAKAWYAKASAGFVSAYREVTHVSPLLASTDEAWRTNLDFFLFEKAVYEIGYEANNRPDWIAIPQGGIAALLDTP